MSSVFIVGNGQSRKDIDLQSLKDQGVLIGCNALYRDIHPHILFAVDRKMVQELERVQYPGQTYFYRNPDLPKKKPALPNFHQIRKEERIKNSGITAYCWAMKTFPKSTFYILGFDFENGENVYKNTENYIDRQLNKSVAEVWKKRMTEIIRNSKVETYLVIGEFAKAIPVPSISKADFKERFQA